MLLCVSSQLHLQWYHVDSLKSAKVGLCTPWKLVNATNQRLSPQPPSPPSPPENTPLTVYSRMPRNASALFTVLWPLSAVKWLLLPPAWATECVLVSFPHLPSLELGRYSKAPGSVSLTILFWSWITCFHLMTARGKNPSRLTQAGLSLAHFKVWLLLSIFLLRYE